MSADKDIQAVERDGVDAARWREVVADSMLLEAIGWKNDGEGFTRKVDASIVKRRGQHAASPAVRGDVARGDVVLPGTFTAEELIAEMRKPDPSAQGERERFKACSVCYGTGTGVDGKACSSQGCSAVPSGDTGAGAKREARKNEARDTELLDRLDNVFTGFEMPLPSDGQWLVAGRSFDDVRAALRYALQARVEGVQCSDRMDHNRTLAEGMELAAKLMERDLGINPAYIRAEALKLRAVTP